MEGVTTGHIKVSLTRKWISGVTADLPEYAPTDLTPWGGHLHFYARAGDHLLLLVEGLGTDPHEVVVSQMGVEMRSGLAVNARGRELRGWVMPNGQFAESTLSWTRLEIYPDRLCDTVASLAVSHGTVVDRNKGLVLDVYGPYNPHLALLIGRKPAPKLNSVSLVEAEQVWPHRGPLLERVQVEFHVMMS